MWGNIAGRLGANDLNSTLQKIGNAVAPTGEDEYDEEEDYDEYDDEYEEYSEDEGEEGGGFGFVGMLARALDEKQENDDSDKDDDDESAEFINLSYKEQVANENASSIHKTEPPAMTSLKTSEANAPRNQAQALSAESLLRSKVSHTLQEEELVRQKAENEPPRQAQKTVANKTVQVEPPKDEAKPISATLKLSTMTAKAQPVVVDPLGQQRTHKSSSIQVSLQRSIPPQPRANAVSKEATNEAAVAKAKSPFRRQETKQTEKKMGQRKPDQTNPRGHSSSVEIKEKPQDKRKEPSENSHRDEPHPREQNKGDPRTLTIDKDDKVAFASANLAEAAVLDDIRAANKLLLKELANAKEEISKLSRASSHGFDSTREKLSLDFQEKEARLLQATTEEHQHEIRRLEQKMQSEIHSMTEQLARDRKHFLQEQNRHRETVERSEARAEQAGMELKKFQKNQEALLHQSQQREDRAIRMAEDKVAQTMAMLDERDEQIASLKKLTRDLESTMNEHQEGAEEAEEEVEELQTENESLQEHVATLEHECEGLKAHVALLLADAENFGGMQMELTLLREERDRERAKSESFVQSALHSNTQVESERDEALSELRDIQQQKAATLADLEIAKADIARITIANGNLGDALEAFQDERRAEMELLDEQRKEAESAIACAHDAAMEVLRQTHSSEIQQLQSTADMALTNKMGEVGLLERRVEKLKSENNQTRRSLDEAIHRLQTSQEDVIDRVLMKNILLDWCTMVDKKKRQQVLELMANVLHFTEEERENVHLTHMDIESVRSRVVGAFVAPLPPSKADVEHLEGKNVGEKFLSFMLAETDEGL